MATNYCKGRAFARPREIFALFALIFVLLYASPSWATTYYLSTSGSDTNSGTSSAAPWQSPDHNLNCGDTIIAQPGTYSPAHFQSGHWGTVNCPSGNNVAWLQCSKFDNCKIAAGNGDFGMYVDKSYWGVQGWEATVSSGGYTCFAAAPSERNPVTVHHIIFANDVANGCQGGGFGAFNNGSASVDYIVIVGSIAYNAAQSSLHCYSGISIYQPQQSDIAAGTHIYVAGNFSYDNLDPASCNDTAPTDGEGVIFDTFDGSQGSFPGPYAAQAVEANNILVSNGGRGSEVQNNSAGSKHAPIYRYNNTMWGNSTDNRQKTALCADMDINVGLNINDYSNLVQTTSAMSCGGNYLYGYFVYDGGSTDVAHSNWIYGPSGLYQGSWDATGYSFNSNNVVGQNPDFQNPTSPSAPSCSGSANVPGCMAGVIADFTPTNSPAKKYGYQNPRTSAKDPLFPKWVCNVNLPAGLVAGSC